MNKIQDMGDLMADYEAELIAREKAERPMDEARRAARIQREIDSGLRDADGMLIVREYPECEACGEQHDPEDGCGEEEEEEDDEGDAGY